MLRNINRSHLLNWGPARRGFFETLYHESVTMSPLSNAHVNNILRQNDLEVIIVNRNSEIQQSTLERCVMRMRIISSCIEGGYVTDSDLVSNLMAFFVLMNQHVGSRYPTSNLPPWAIRLKQELIEMIETKVDFLNSELSEKLKDLKKELLEKFVEGRKETATSIAEARMEMRLMFFVVSIVAVLLNWNSLVSPALA